MAAEAGGTPGGAPGLLRAALGVCGPSCCGGHWLNQGGFWCRHLTGPPATAQFQCTPRGPCWAPPPTLLWSPENTGLWFHGMGRAACPGDQFLPNFRVKFI